MDGKTFTIQLIKSIVWPIVLLIIFFSIKEEFLNLIPKISKLTYRDAIFEFNNRIQRLGKTTDITEKNKLISKVIQPSKNSPLSIEEGAQLLANDIISKLPQKFTINDVNSIFDNLFKNKNTLNDSRIKKFKSIVISKLRSNKALLETNNNGLLEFNKL